MNWKREPNRFPGRNLQSLPNRETTGMVNQRLKKNISERMISTENRVPGIVGNVTNTRRTNLLPRKVNAKEAKKKRKKKADGHQRNLRTIVLEANLIAGVLGPEVRRSLEKTNNMEVLQERNHIHPI